MSSVTIIIEGHGAEHLGERLEYIQNVNLLSFCGMPGELGIMKGFGEDSISIATISKLGSHYNEFLYGEGKDDPYMNNQIGLFESSPKMLDTLFKSNGLLFPCGFKMTNPVSERTFYLRPNPGENVRKSGRCERDSKKMHCPEYGITIIASSEKEDKPFTLASLKSPSPSHRRQMNLLLSPSTLEYWNQRSGLILKPILELNPHITLSQIINIFVAMGFDNIYIHDPTCRTCERPVGKLKQLVYSIM